MPFSHSPSADPASITDEKPGFQFVAPQNGCAVIFSSPHSGRYYPQDFLDLLKVPLIDLRRVEDAFVDLLISPLTRLDAGMISAVYARSFVDLNRSPDELDSRMFRDGPPNPAGERSPRVEAGLGCIPRIGASGQDIHKRMLSRMEADDRLARAYTPYHSTLENWLATTRKQTGHAVLVDCHSMPSVIGGRKLHADIVLGTRHGQSCDESLTRLVESEFTRLGYRVLRNSPYAGGHLTQRHGRPAQEQHAIQIEINRRLYLDECSVCRSSGFNMLQSHLKWIGRQIIEWSAKKRPRQ
tara:strand:+ start:4012 stop:4902 length:891 start_codon:yes stop_codon:yes gene_type:complete